MGFFSKLWGQTPKPASRLEAFLQRFNDQPTLVDDLIRGSKSTHRLMNAICFACLQSGYAITREIRDSLRDLPKLHPGTATSSFQFDSVAREVVAFVFFTVMADHFTDSDEEDDESRGANDDELFESIKAARYLAESVISRNTELGDGELLKGRILRYSQAHNKRANLFEVAATRILEANRYSHTDAKPQLEDLLGGAIVQRVLASDILPATQSGIRAMYSEWKSNPASFGS
jgi:hypothetical protein